MPSFLKNVKLFQAPNGFKETTVVSNVRPEDVEFFESRNYQLSIEQLPTGVVAAYAMPPNGKDEDEIVVVDFNDEGPLSTFQKLAKMCRKQHEN